MDSAADVKKLKDIGFFNNFFQAIADGIAKFLGVISSKPTQMANKTKGEILVDKQYERDAASQNFKEAQEWVKANSISDGTYPQRPVTREEAWAMLYRASKVNK
ncbi:hypothetical protein [Pseudobacillus wudalianchiensis]|uniref:SLH domain-containing protein n=1 Tax=Pseudobacillus wudalianchiensis TaxID=1743143 RepID=A0A1B9AMZ1_9BACI|nr:hypothetical protein A8F95_11440 [Bacillus wudalianchiensis]